MRRVQGRAASIRTGRNVTAYFPMPLHDETVTSIIARYRRHVGLTHTAVSMEIFGKETNGVFAALPPKLDVLAQTMPVCLGYSLERLIREHTALDYFAAFLSAEQRQQVIERTLIGDARGTRPRGFNSRPVPPATHLRFCPRCIVEQVKEHGEAYWRRTHQLPIATICPQHGVPLRSSTIKVVGQWSSYVVPDSGNCPEDAAEVIPNTPCVDRDMLLELSRTAERLLQGRYPPNVDRTYAETQMLPSLASKGYIYADNRVQWDELHVAAKPILAGAVAAFPDIMVGGEIGPWFLGLRATQTGVSTDRVLLAHYVIERLAPKMSAFGPAPWPCFNPLAGHLGERTVTDMRRLRSLAGKSYARFTCDCGYAYTLNIKDDGTVGRPAVFEFGPTLDEHIKKAIATGQTFRQTHLKAGVGSNTMLRHARKRGIEHPWRQL